MMRSIQVLFLTTMLASFSACDDSPITLVSGHYEGSLTNHLDRQTYNQMPVSTDVTVDGSTLPVIYLKDAYGNVQMWIQVTAVSGSSVSLRASMGVTQIVTLTQPEGRPCYMSTPAPNAPIVTLCATGPEVSFEIQDTNHVNLLSVVMYKNDQSNVTQFSETPAPVTLTQAIDRARAMSFQSKIEFEHISQAKNTASAAYLHLLPSINFGTIASATSGFGGILGIISDFCPFLFPDNWLKADAASEKSKAENDAGILMRLDAGVQVEGLIYTYVRDAKTRDYTQAVLDHATQIRQEVLIRENLGELERGSTANMDSIINQIQKTLTVMDQMKAEDLSAISQALGYFNPKTVTDAIIDQEQYPIEHAPSMNYDTINSNAISRSFELDQMAHLIIAAKDNEGVTTLSWADPKGQGALGFALPSEISVNASQIRELQVTKQQLQSILSQKVYNAVTDYNQAIKSFKVATDGMVIQQTRLDTELANLNAGVRVDFYGLVGIFQDYLSGQIAIETARANYRVARTAIDRFQLQGNYARF